MQSLLDDWDGETLVVRRDRPSGAVILIALHSSRLGPAGGGTRSFSVCSTGSSRPGHPGESPSEVDLTDADAAWTEGRDGLFRGSVDGDGFAPTVGLNDPGFGERQQGVCLIGMVENL